ncbi:restriction endonuclease subunit S [Rhizobium sp. 57MFTsu3.2]|uniref:restriction endonuclease subunit S n=1 Tax=Rhizobium sp. 57MFTsu3.2 TaxID=1048681 RepID=UPI00146A7F28
MTFGDVLEVVERPVNLNDDVEYQLVTAKRSRGGVVARSRLLGRDVLTKTQFQIARDDFLMSNRQIIHGGCGIVPPALDGAVVSNEYSVLRPNSKLLLEFLAYLSHSIYFQQTCFHASVGVDVEKMIFDCERWLDFKIHLPSLHEQRRVAEILSSVDGAIAATRAVIEQTRKVKQGVLERLLTKGIGHTRFKQTEIGEIPEGWGVVELDGITPPDRKITYGIVQAGPDYPEGVPYIRVSDMGEYQIDEGSVLRTSPEIASKYLRSELQRDDIVFALRGKVGHVLRTPESLIGANLTQGTARIACGGRIISEFLLWALRSPQSERQYKREIKGSTFQELTLGSLKKIRVPLPPVEEQQLLAHRIEDIEAGLRSSERSLLSLLEAKSALMSDLLTGRKRVTDALTIAAE